MKDGITARIWDAHGAETEETAATNAAKDRHRVP
jgi:hypothetical protein